MPILNIYMILSYGTHYTPLGHTVCVLAYACGIQLASGWLFRVREIRRRRAPAISDTRAQQMMGRPKSSVPQNAWRSAPFDVRFERLSGEPTENTVASEP